MEVKITKCIPEKIKNPPKTMSGVIFGTQFTDHMFCMEFF